jgi:hypothetical protein
VANVLDELSPYYFQGVEMPSDCGPGWWMWSVVVEVLRRYELTGVPQPQLPRSIQRPGALIGLAVGLAVRQAALH